MSRISVQVTYRHGKPIAAYIYLADRNGQKSARTEEINPGVIVDYSQDNVPLGIEILAPVSRQDELLSVFDRLGLSRPDPKDLEPLLAA